MCTYYYRQVRLIFKPNNKFQTFEIRNGCTSHELIFSRIDATIGSTKMRLAGPGRPKILNKTNKDWKYALLQTGLTDWSRRNRSYWDLLITLEVNEAINKSIFESYIDKYSPATTNYSTNSRDSPLDWPSTEILTELDYILIALKIFNDWNIKSIWAKFGVLKHKLKEVFSNFE